MGRKPWRKVWGDKLRSSPKWRKLTFAQRGFYFECLMMCDDATGQLRLRPGKPLETADLAYEFGARSEQIDRYLNRLERVGLLAREDGFWTLQNAVSLFRKCPTNARQMPDKCTTNAPQRDNGGKARQGVTSRLGDGRAKPIKTYLLTEVLKDAPDALSAEVRHALSGKKPGCEPVKTSIGRRFSRVTWHDDGSVEVWDIDAGIQTWPVPA